ncbi:MAG: hypothetical protein JO036_01375 [Candidatus Eremiobacteraeota bacterium]|nr:hypothetical protein [Candidatus Eremiobacteraeota bacterium]
MNGSWVAFAFFVAELGLLVLALARDLGRREVVPSPPAQPDLDRSDRIEDPLDEDTRFLYGETVRYNDGFVQSIDALDNGLIAIAAGIIGVALFTADKLGQLHPVERIAGLGMLFVSATTCAFAFVHGPRDIGSRLRFVVDFALDPAETTREAIERCALVGDDNARLCARKRRAAIAAVTLLFGSALLVLLSRAAGSVVQ